MHITFKVLILQLLVIIHSSCERNKFTCEVVSNAALLYIPNSSPYHQCSPYPGAPYKNQHQGISKSERVEVGSETDRKDDQRVESVADAGEGDKTLSMIDLSCYSSFPSYEDILLSVSFCKLQQGTGITSLESDQNKETRNWAIQDGHDSNSTTTNNNVSNNNNNINNSRENVDNKEWTKNFASPDCGAKIVKWSEEAVNAGHLISKNNDEYMLSECSKSVWFVLELCEQVRVTRFELENLELYAGTPRQIQLSVAQTYSSRSKNWINLGDFTSTGHKKATESFSSGGHNVFGKFVRFEILSNHGEEHYCTVTSLRVFGVSEYEVLGGEEEEEEEEENHGGQDQRQKANFAGELGDQGGNLGHRLNQFASSERIIEMSRNTNNFVETVRSISLQLRNDTCVDSVTLKIYQNRSKVEDSGSIGSNDRHQDVKRLAGSGEVTQKAEKTGGGGDGMTGPAGGGGVFKESGLVQLNNRVKYLEKNTTSLVQLFRQVNQTAAQHAGHMEDILDAVIKAKTSFQVSTKEQNTIRQRLVQLIDRVDNFEQYVEESSQTIKVIVLCLVVLCGLLVHHIASADSRHSRPSGSRARSTETRDSGTMTEPGRTSQFSGPWTEKLIQLSPNGRRPDRRTTWCAGSKHNLAPAVSEDNFLHSRVRELRVSPSTTSTTSPHSIQSPASSQAVANNADSLLLHPQLDLLCHNPAGVNNARRFAPDNLVNPPNSRFPNSSPRGAKSADDIGHFHSSNSTGHLGLSSAYSQEKAKQPKLSIVPEDQCSAVEVEMVETPVRRLSVAGDVGIKWKGLVGNNGGNDSLKANRRVTWCGSRSNHD